MLYSLFKHALVPLSKLFINEVNGLQNIPKEEGVIFAINHVSYLDTVLMTTVIADKFHRKLHNLGKTELFESVLGNIFHKAIETIPIKRDSSGEDALKEAIHYLHKGKFISIYPEGGRSRDGQLRRAKTGVARLALRSKKKVIPVGISGTFEIWPANIQWNLVIIIISPLLNLY